MNRTAFYYDNRSNLRAVLDPDNGLTYYTYDSLNRMTSVKNPWGEVTQYEYSPGGRLLKRLLGNGTVACYSYDAVGQVRKLENVKSNLTVISSFEYERNAVGSPVSIRREDGSVIYYEYDPKQQLTKETHVDPLEGQVYGWTWDYDLAGNRTRQEFNGVETTYQYNAANELTEETTDGATTYFEYDHNGNTTAQIAPGGTTQYHWDRENLMTQVDLPDDRHNYFAYDADSKRVEKRDSEGYTRFIYQGPDMLKLLQERDESDDLQAQYTMGNGLEAMRRDDASSFYHYDWLGSTFELTDASEAVIDTYLYNAWGEVLERTGTTGNPHTYVGRERYYKAQALDLYLLGWRYYAPDDARFLSLDPQRDGGNWCAYAGSSPALLTDPAGRAGTPATQSTDRATVVTCDGGLEIGRRTEHMHITAFGGDKTIASGYPPSLARTAAVHPGGPLKLKYLHPNKQQCIWHEFDIWWTTYRIAQDVGGGVTTGQLDLFMDTDDDGQAENKLDKLAGKAIADYRRLWWQEGHGYYTNVVIRGCKRK